MTGARTNTLASLRGSIERIEAHADASAPARVALGHAEADATLQGGLALAAVHEVFAEGRQSAAATGFIAGLAGRVAAPAAAGVDPAGFCRDRIRRAVDGWPRRTRPRSAPRGDRARRRRRRRVADRRRRAGLRCAGRGGAGSLGRSPAVRSRRQPQADAGGAGLRRHRIIAAGGGAAAALDGGDAMDRARGAFAARLSSGARGARRCSTRNSSATVMARSGGGSWNGNVMSAFSRNRRRILSLWLPRLPIDRIKRARAGSAAPA